MPVAFNLPEDDVSSTAFMALQMCPYRQEAVRKWHIYTDGAFSEVDSSRSALAVVIVAEMQDASGGPTFFSFQGCIGARLEDALHHSTYSDGLSSTATELAAAMVAVLW